MRRGKCETERLNGKYRKPKQVPILNSPRQMCPWYAVLTAGGGGGDKSLRVYGSTRGFLA